VKVLLCIASVNLSYGGPAVSVVALANGLARAGLQIGLWCPDNSAESALQLKGSGNVELLTGDLDEAIDHFGMPQLVHDNGIWWAHNHRIARFATLSSLPRVVSTRGMLEPWARRHKPVRKAIAWQLYQRRDLGAASALHVTSDQELRSVSASMPDMKVALIGNGLELPAKEGLAFSGTSHQGQGRQALFLGRIHPVKGLPLLLRAWSLAAPKDWRLVIAGPDESGHRQLLEAEIARLGLASVVSFTGAVTGQAKVKLFAASQLFVLPSHSESFGMAAGEALAHGLPVLTTANVPWPQLETLACGWRVAGSVEAIAAALTEATSCTKEILAQMGQRGRALIADQYGWDKVAERFIELYASVLENPGKRDSA
jgi:glycosyltransferase involved in cell wall biosynthesis